MLEHLELGNDQDRPIRIKTSRLKQDNQQERIGKMKAKDNLSRDALSRLMFEEKIDAKEIAKIYKVSRSCIQRLQKKYGLVVLSRL
jgi:DNA-directed RNA polymerase specialized sigma subunit